MTTDEVRSKYLKFFESRGHKIIPPAPLVLENDPTTLFTSSGMQPLVPYLLGEPHPEGKRVCDSQPSIRVQDIEEVGDNRHTTFFEMLGNWSFGDYFKKEQLKWLFEFLTEKDEGLGLDPRKLYISVFGGDKDFRVGKKEGAKISLAPDVESMAIWANLFEEKGVEAKVANNNQNEKPNIKNGRIFYYGVDKNWWSRSGTPVQMPVGEIGGPDSEIFYDFGADLGLHEISEWKNDPCHPNCDCGRFLEIGNSVFMQYKKIDKNLLEELPNKNVDFGGGLERLVAATNDDPDVFKIDVFEKIISKIENMTGKNYEGNERAMRVIADHIRAANELSIDGVFPSNKMHGYVMRRLIRRAVVKMKSLKDEVSGEDFAKLTDRKEVIEEVEKFNRTLSKGLKEFGKIDDITGKKAFDLFQTYGFPLEITLELAYEKGLKVDVEEFKKAFEEHQEKSRTASAGVFKGGLADHSAEVTRLHTAHHLVLAALQKVVDKNISQKGSNITAERMRMDFNFSRKLTLDEIKKVEELVNEQIDKDLVVTKKIMPKEEAEKLGAQMEFGKKYPDNVSVYFIGDVSMPFSAEFCGGPHVAKLSEIGSRVKITKEESAAAGIRRIYAVVG